MNLTPEVRHKLSDAVKLLLRQLMYKMFEDLI